MQKRLPPDSYQEAAFLLLVSSYFEPNNERNPVVL